MKRKTCVTAMLISAAVWLSACSVTNGDSDPDGTVKPFQELKKITASDAEEDGGFGVCVAIDGDHAIVGGGLSGDGIRGAAYVFYRLQGGPDNWGEVKKIQGSDTVSLDDFGYAVAIDGEDAVVGARSMGQIGAAYVFSRNQGGANNWGQVKKLVASDPAYNVYFGWAVAIDGDLIAVGAPQNRHGISSRGAVYIFHRNAGGPGNWGEVKKVVPTSANRFNWLGTTVALSGEVLAVGAPDSGAAYIFLRNLGGSNNWGEAKRIVPSNANVGNYFGRSVSVDGDIAVIGADCEGWPDHPQGAAYVISRDRGGSGNWGEVKRLIASDASDNDHFGFSVAVSGKDILVGAYNEGVTLMGRGAAYFFRRNEGGPDAWGEVKKSIASDAEAEDIYGFSVALDGDYAIIGATGSKDNGGHRQGAAYILKRQ